MVLKEGDIQLVVNHVKTRPRTVQEISRLINKSWVTTDSYVKKIKERTGLIDVKTFRKGTQGALKIVYYNHADAVLTDDIKESLYSQIKNGRFKNDFDFMEVFQFIPEKSKKSFSEEYADPAISSNQQIIGLLRQATNQLYIFSGNLSFINMKENNKQILEIIEELLQNKVRIKILCRINLASLSNINKLTPLMNKYPELIEIKHRYQPLRGFIIDDKIARFKDEELLTSYKQDELHKNTRIFYELYDADWIIWLQKIFWNMYRSAMEHSTRVKEIKQII